MRYTPCRFQNNSTGAKYISVNTFQLHYMLKKKKKMYAKQPIHEIKYRFNVYVIIVKKKPSSIVTKNN